MKGFEKQHKKVGGRKPGTKNKRTIIKDALGINSIEALKQICLENWHNLLTSSNYQIKFIATKEISKYLFAGKRETPFSLTEDELEILRVSAGEEMKRRI